MTITFFNFQELRFVTNVLVTLLHHANVRTYGIMLERFHGKCLITSPLLEYFSCPIPPYAIPHNNLAYLRKNAHFHKTRPPTDVTVTIGNIKRPHASNSALLSRGFTFWKHDNRKCTTKSIYTHCYSVYFFRAESCVTELRKVIRTAMWCNSLGESAMMFLKHYQNFRN